MCGIEVKEVKNTKTRVYLRLELMEAGEDKKHVVMGTWCKNDS